MIVLGIIWYRNRQKAKDAELAKSKLISGNKPQPVPVKSDIGKTVLVNNSVTKFYQIGTMSLAYTKSTIGEYAGTIEATQTDSGDTSFYKIINTSGQKLYVLKSQVKVS